MIPSDADPNSPAYLLGYFRLTGGACTACSAAASGLVLSHADAAARATFLVLGEGLVWLDLCARHLRLAREAMQSRGKGGLRVRYTKINGTIWESTASRTRYHGDLGPP